MTHSGSPAPTADAGSRAATAADPGGRGRHRPDAAHDPLLRGARAPRPRRALRGRLPPVRHRGPRAAAVHPRPPRRRRASRSPRSASCSRTRRRGPATGRRSASPTTPSEKQRHPRGRRRPRRSPGRLAAPQDRSARGDDHRGRGASRAPRGPLDDLDAGREPTHEHPSTSRHAADHAVQRRIDDPPGRRTVARQRRPRLPAPQLPPLLRRPARVARRHLDADRRPGLADPRS